jgi:hypothetical protein
LTGGFRLRLLVLVLFGFGGGDHADGSAETVVVDLGACAVVNHQLEQIEGDRGRLIAHPERGPACQPPGEVGGDHRQQRSQFARGGRISRFRLQELADVGGSSPARSCAPCSAVR